MSSAAALAVQEMTRLYRIGEVSRIAALKPFVLRYWETEFPMLQPVKSPRGHRLYRQQDVDMVLTIKRLLYDEGFTIAGARRHLEGNGVETSSTVGSPMLHEVRRSTSASSVDRKLLLELRESLQRFLTLLQSK